MKSPYPYFRGRNRVFNISITPMISEEVFEEVIYIPSTGITFSRTISSSQLSSLVHNFTDDVYYSYAFYWCLAGKNTSSSTITITCNNYIENYLLYSSNSSVSANYYFTIFYIFINVNVGVNIKMHVSSSIGDIAYIEYEGIGSAICSLIPPELSYSRVWVRVISYQSFPNFTLLTARVSSSDNATLKCITGNTNYRNTTDVKDCFFGVPFDSDLLNFSGGGTILTSSSYRPYYNRITYYPTSLEVVSSRGSF